MFPNRLALPLLAVTCVTAAAAGGYFAARQNTVPTPAAAQSQPADFAAPSTAAATASKPVQETEAIVGDVKPSAAATPSAAPAPAPVASTPSPVRAKSSRRSDATVSARSTV